VPAAALIAVPFEQGPVSLAEVEIAWGRIAAGAAVVVSLGALGLWWWLA
jgi:hypothetical protein